MKTMGLIGGLSWESSAEYYRIINQATQQRLGGVHSAKSIMFSFDFGEIEALQSAGRWSKASALMVDAAQRLERADADFLVICSNTMHRMAQDIQAAVILPLLHIVDPTGERIKASGVKRVALLGTAYTMEHPFYKGRLAEKFGIEVRVPDEVGRALVHRIIYEELVKGIVKPESRAAYRAVMARLIDEGAQAIILGCTEIMLLVKPEDSAVPLFDTATLHAEAAVAFALRG
jgi:aspartate racemase